MARVGICINNKDYEPALELHKAYPVLRDVRAERDGDLRIVDESGEDYLYPSGYFIVVELSKSQANAMKRSAAAAGAGA